MPKGWQLAPTQVGCGATVARWSLPALPTETAAAGQDLTVTVAVEDAGAAALDRMAISVRRLARTRRVH